MKTWRCNLEGVSADVFTVVTNHNPLAFLQTPSVLTFKWVQSKGGPKASHCQLDGFLVLL